MAMTDEERRESRRKASRKWYENNKEKSRENSRKWKEKNRERNREIIQKWRKNNAEKEREYRDSNRERLLENTRRWRKNSPENDIQYRENNKIGILANSRRASTRQKIAIPTPKTGKWTDGELAFLIKTDLPLLEVAITLNRSYGAVSNQISRLRKAGVIE